MFFRFQQTANLITIDDAFARLTEVRPNGDTVFEFTYSVKPSEVLSRGAKLVKITAMARYVPPKPILGQTQKGSVDTNGLVNNIRSLLPDAKATALQRATYVISSVNSNVASLVSPDVARSLAAGVDPRNIPQLNGTKLQSVPAIQLKQSNNPQPVLHVVARSAVVSDVNTALSASALAQPQRLMHDMVTRQGIDPSYVTELTPRAASEAASRGGLLTSTHATEQLTDPATQLANFHLFPPISAVPPKTSDQVNDIELVQALVPVTSVSTDVFETVVLPAAKMRLEGADLTSVFVQFDLIDPASNEPLDTVIKTLNVTKELLVFRTPKQPPSVKVATFPPRSRASLNIRQVDRGAASVQLYKKTVFAASAKEDEYSLIGTYGLTADQQALQVQVEMPQSSAAIYRVIPVGAQGAQGFEYTNVVIKPPRYTPVRSIALTGAQIDQGIQLEARNIPPECVAIQFLRWNLTTHETAYTTVNGDVGFVDDAARTADILTTIDKSVTSNNVYRYVARLVYSAGMTEDAGNVIIEFIEPAPGQVNTTITDLVVNHDGTPDVLFSINTSTNNTDMDVIKQMLGNQDLLQYFQGDVQNQRDQLSQLIAHNVQRVDLTTGVREDFGVITVSSFADSTFRKNRAIDPLQYGHSYRYEIYPLLRAPETLFSGFDKPAVDPVTKKPYTYKPVKFFHPLTLTRGVVVTPQGAAQRYAKDPMSFGVVGAVTTVEASFDNDTAKIVSQTATRFNRVLNVVTWQVQGDISQVDHFVIMKQVNGIRTLLGKAHSEFPYGACQYLHSLTHRDNGSISYVIVPVMIDYLVGPSVVTNVLVVDVP
jgi:hypothetical protein